jgi:hypothetical protein
MVLDAVAMPRWRRRWARPCSSAARGKMPLEEVSRHLWPFWLTTLIVLMLVTFIPPLAMTIRAGRGLEATPHQADAARRLDCRAAMSSEVQRISKTSTPRSSLAHARSAVTTRRSRWMASAMQARSPSERPAAWVAGHSSATRAASAAVNVTHSMPRGSIRPRTPSIAWSSRLTRVSASARLIVDIHAPESASVTRSLPGS